MPRHADRIRRTARVLTPLGLSLTLGAIPAWSWAQSFPSKPLRLIVAFPPGASSDLVGRLIVAKMGEQMGQQVIPDNRPGAGGNLGLAMTSKAAPDGYTMGIATASIAVSPSLYNDLGYDPVRDLAPVARLTNIPNILIVHPSVPARSLRDFINLARATPGRLNFGTGGTGTTNHLANELLKYLAKIDIVHVPYKGVTQAMMAMIQGEVDEVVMPVSTALPQIRQGKVRPLAVLTEKRIPTLPEVPTGIEAGVPGFTMPLWYGMFAPGATPRDLVGRLNRELVKALQSKDVVDKLTAMGVDPWPGTAEQLGELLKSEIERYGAVVRAAKIPKQ